MSRWFRVYDELVDDPKVQRLPDALFKALINLWCLASKGDGVLPPIEEIAFVLRVKPDKAYRMLADLRVAGLLDDDETGCHPHNWHGRQFKSDVSNERVKRHRERLRNVTSTVSATPPETETETETETEKKVRGPLPRISHSPEFRLEEEKPPDKPNGHATNGNGQREYPDEFEGLWSEYRVIGSKNSSKLEAYKAWAKLPSDEVGPCFSGFVDYVLWIQGEWKKKSGFPAVKHLSTFINERGWEPFLEGRA